jgi:streptomycin 6-kinase
MDMVEEHYHPMNHRPEVEGMDMEDRGMGEDMMVEVEVVEREPEGMVLVRHWTGNGAARHR